VSESISEVPCTLHPAACGLLWRIGGRDQRVGRDSLSIPCGCDGMARRGWAWPLGSRPAMLGTTVCRALAPDVPTREPACARRNGPFGSAELDNGCSTFLTMASSRTEPSVECSQRLVAAPAYHAFLAEGSILPDARSTLYEIRA
jgi:hypothetical protein